MTRMGAALAAILLACGGGGGAADVVEATDAPTDGTTDAADEGADTATDTATDTPVEPGPYGLPIRVPVADRDEDHVCRVARPGVLDGVVYVQASITDCVPLAGCKCETLGAWVSVDGAVSPVTATYDYGGNHRNDAIELAYGGAKLRLYHSYFGMGFRKCAPMDCMQVTDAGGAVVEDGCVEGERSIPVQCVDVCPDGKVLPFKDFPACPAELYEEMLDAGCEAGTWQGRET